VIRWLKSGSSKIYKSEDLILKIRLVE